MRSVLLRGLERNIRIGAEESIDVREDANTILESVQDRYYVDELVVSFGAREDNRRIRIIVGDRISENLGAATMRDILYTLAAVASYGRPVALTQRELPTT